MKISFIILSLVYLFASAICFQLAPSLSVKTPVDFELEINGNIFNNEPKTSESDKLGSVNQCFCVPSDPRNELVTNLLGPKDHRIERLVLYLYRVDGKLYAYIPNKQKQKEIADLTIDLEGGDILAPLSLETAAEIFDNSPSVLSQQPQDKRFEPEDASEEIDISAYTDILPINSDTEKEIIEPVVEETSETKPIDEIFFDNFSPFNEQDKAIYDDVPSAQDLFINKPELEDHFLNQDVGEILSYVPEKPDFINQPTPSLQQKPNLRLDILQGKNNIKFNDWLTNQLSYIVLDNSMSQSNVEELRKHILDVLKRNGMFISNTGLLFDSAGNILKMSNIKLRTILIGDPIDYHSFNYREEYAAPQISYMQVILIISIDPPEILGVAPMGKVFLPRKIKSQDLLNLRTTNQNEGKTHFLRLSPQLGCKNCKSRSQYNTQQDDFNNNDVPYFELPLRRSFDGRKNQPNQQSLLRSFFEAPSEYPTQPERRTSSEGTTDLGGMLQNLLSIFGTPNLFSDQTRRLLGGKLSRKDKLGTKTYNNLPDYRIIGGKPATSSGTPIVSKGRSGFLPSFH